MKKLLFTLFTLLLSLHAGAILPGSYTDPSQLPAAFTWNLVRYDYRGTDVNGDPILVGQREVTVEFDPTFINSASKYGKLTLKNMYSHESLTLNATGQEFPFDNSRSYWAFQYDEVANTITFSFQATLIGRLKFTTTPYSNSRAAKSSSTYGYIAATKTEQSSYWNSTETTPYAYGGSQHVAFVIDLENHTITSQGPWGVFYTKEGGSSPSYVLEYFDYSVFQEPEPTTLAWIENEANGVLNKNYTVADQLVGVYAQGGSLWCKDQGNISNVKSTNPGNTDYMKNMMFEMHGRNPSLEWDQSNWVELDFGEVTAERAAQIYNTYVGHTLKAGTVKGEYVDNTNYRIELSEDPVADGDLSYDPNYYCPVNFMGATDVTGSNGKNFYFLNPKVQEYAYATVAVWKGDDVFVVPAKDDAQGVNGADLSGAFRVNWGLNCMTQSEIEPLLTNNNAYEFHAIIRKPTSSPANSPARIIESVTPKDVDPTNDFIVYPLDLTASNTQIVTGITTVRSNAVDDGYYYTITGQRVTNPTPGFYIRGGKKVIVR